MNHVIPVSDNSPNYLFGVNRIEDPTLEFLPDFFVLMNADVLFRANSTFSFWAALLGDVVTYSPVVEGKTGLRTDIDFVYGNHPKMIGDFHGASPQVPSDFIFV